MLSQNRYFIKTGCLVLASILLLAVIHSIYRDRIYNSFVVQVDFVADKSGILAIYYPDKKGRYDESRSYRVDYSTGEQNKKLTIVLHNPNELLRVDPGVKANGLTIQRLSFSRFGIVERLNPEKIKRHIVQTNGVTLSQIQEGLRVTFGSGDPQLLLRIDPIPRPGWLRFCTYLTVLFLICLFFCLFLYRFFHSRLVDHPVESLLIALLFLVAGGKLDWPFGLMALFIALFLYSLLRTTITYSRYGFNGLHVASIGPLLIISCFLFLIVWPLYRTISPESTFNSVVSNSISDFFVNEEKETLEKRIKSLIGTVEKSFSSRSPLRKDLINLNATIKISGLGFSPTSKAILGKNGMFFEGYGQRRVEDDITGSFDNITDYMGLIPFTESELEDWLVCLEERYYWLKEQGIDYIFALAPTKALVYPENLPSRILNLKTRLSRPTRYEQLVTYMKEKSLVPVVDLRTLLIAAKQQTMEKKGNDDLLLYYKTDFHWNYYGSFLAYRAIIDEINRAYPRYQFNASQLEDFTLQKRTDWVHPAFIRTLGLDPLEHQNETYLTFFPKPGSIYSGISDFGEKGISDYTLPKRRTKEFGGKQTRFRLLENKNAEVPLIFVIGDSFAQKYFGFFSKHAKKTISFRTVYSFLPEVYIDNSPDLVIQEVLNMYLLQKPPVNPASIKGARRKALAGGRQGF